MPTTDKPRPPLAEVLALLGAEPLALAPSAVRSLGAPGAMWGWDDEDEGPGYELVGDLAVIPVRGVLLQRWCWWWSGYDALAKAFERALLDGAARGVVLAFDSPGGVVAGLFDTAQRMRAAAEAAGKPVVAVSDERCYSAAYALACVADAIVVPRTAGAGSVGVIGTMVSWSAALEAEGVDVRVLVSGAEKADGHPALPLSDAAVAREQARVDSLAEVFFAWVAERRGLSTEDVRALEAGIRLGPEAVAAKLADRVGTLADLLDGSLSIDDCCSPPGPTEVKEVPVPPQGEDAFRGHGRPSPTRNTMALQLAALLAALGADDAAALQTVTDLRALRSQVHTLTGAQDDAAALGTLHAWKRDAQAAAELRAQAESDKKAAVARERAELLDGAVAALKLTPAERALDGTPEGWTTALPNEGLKAFLARAGAPATPPRPPAPGAPSGGSLTDEQRSLAEQLGLDPAAYAKALAAQG